MDEPRLLGPPSWASVWTGVFFGFVFYTLYGLTSFLGDFVPWGFAWYFSWEPKLPLLPAWAVVYLSLNLLLGLLPLVLRRWQDMAPLFCTMVAETLVAVILFLLFPIEAGFPPRVSSGWLGFADLLNLEHNYMPSLHVTYAVTAALVIGRRGGRGARLFFGLWAGAIALSTILIHEHHLIDVVTGGSLAWLAVRYLYDPLVDSPVADRVPFPRYLRLLVEAARFLRHSEPPREGMEV